MSRRPVRLMREAPVLTPAGVPARCRFLDADGRFMP